MLYFRKFKCVQFKNKLPIIKSEKIKLLKWVYKIIQFLNANKLTFELFLGLKSSSEIYLFVSYYISLDEQK